MIKLTGENNQLKWIILHNSVVKLHILGTAQDGGIPHLDCNCENCKNSKRLVASLGIISNTHHLLIDATPHFEQQVRLFGGLSQLDGILLTHLHIGHYIGLLQLGREVASTSQFPVYMTQELADFISTNKPFSYLVERQQIIIHLIIPEHPVVFGNCSITAFEVPHRNEDGNTVGYKITDLTTSKSCLYIPDIDILDEITQQRIADADLVIFDGSFYSHDELPRLKEVPHPPIRSTINILNKQLPKSFFFTHFNHSNPILHNHTKQKELHNLGYDLVNDDMIIEL